MMFTFSHWESILIKLSPSRVLLILVASAALVLSGCAAEPDAGKPAAGASGEVDGSGDSGASTPEGDAGTSGSALAQAAKDGMPDVGLVECPELTEYEYRPTSGNTQWYFKYVCPSRDAFDATVAALLAKGYDESPGVYSTGDYMVERNHLQAGANGGSTEAQLNITGSPDELEFEIYITLTLP